MTILKKYYQRKFTSNLVQNSKFLSKIEIIAVLSRNQKYLVENRHSTQNCVAKNFRLENPNFCQKLQFWSNRFGQQKIFARKWNSVQNLYRNYGQRSNFRSKFSKKIKNCKKKYCFGEQTIFLASVKSGCLQLIYANSFLIKFSIKIRVGSIFSSIWKKNDENF